MREQLKAFREGKHWDDALLVYEKLTSEVVQDINRRGPIWLEWLVCISKCILCDSLVVASIGSVARGQGPGLEPLDALAFVARCF